ncbi:DUF1450 domain-containing protein [Aquibacillus salsiterrae]|uniref:YuzB family protein n=1 Tax=Aquibacillus salsiterrae TaxID=2950439 RepID=A0A9X3WC89_9BACI|nr:DUF1450 domain-containing protein [Aquibacillus salsiterrae]MDC3417110.1 YuzB family protein [Aquibacillus salsiterrae]
MGILSKLLGKNGPKKIECCETNLMMFYSDEDLDNFEDFADEHGLEIKEMECLDNCEECPLSPYAVFDKQKIFADSPEEVLTKIKDIITKEQTT